MARRTDGLAFAVLLTATSLAALGPSAANGLQANDLRSGGDRAPKGSEVSANFAVASPFYETPWFLLLAVLAGGAAVAGLDRLRLRQLQRRELELEQRVDKTVASLRESEERYRSFVHDFRGIAFRGTFDFRPILFHGAVEEISGYSVEEFLAGRLRWDQLIHPDDLPGLVAATTELSSVPGFSSEREYRIVRKDGQERWVLQLVKNVCDDQGRPVLVQGAIYDVTERKATAEALRKSEARLAEAQRVAGLGTWEWIVATDELVWSEQMYRLHRRDPALGPMTDFWLQSVYPEDRPEVSRRLSEALTASRSYAVDHRIVRGDGSHCWVHAEAAVDRNERGEPLRMIGTAQDITERRREEEERRRLETQLLETQKMESLGLLAGGIAHDFNNLLMAILGNADLARQHLAVDTPARLHLDRIESATRRAADLANQMLAYAGKGRTVVERVNLSDLVEDLANLLQAAMPDRATLHYRLERRLPAVEADATQLRQVVMNLILNAAEALGPEGGEIVLATGALTCDAAALAELHLSEGLAVGRYVYLEVADSGCGMDEETRARLFDPFFSTKFAGRGLGLAAVLGIVRAHRGAIRVRSELHRGTAMRVLLPPCTGPAAAAVADASPEESFRGEGKVLVVDDDDGVREVAQSLLESLGFEVLTAADGLEGVSMFRLHRKAIRLVLLDVAMPRLDGPGALAEMRRIRRDVRVVLCSGYGELETQARLSGVEVEGFLQKPFTLIALREQLRSILAG